MAENTYRTDKPKKKTPTKKVNFSSGPSLSEKLSFVKDRKFQIIWGFLLLLSSIYLSVALISYLFTGKADQSVIESILGSNIASSGTEIENWLGILGGLTSHFFIFKWFGLSAFFIPPLLFSFGVKSLFEKELFNPYLFFKFAVFFIFWIGTLLGTFIIISGGADQISFVCGGIGYGLASFFSNILGWGSFLLLIFALLVFIVYYFNVTSLIGLNKKVKEGIEDIERNLEESVKAIKEKDFPDETPIGSDLNFSVTTQPEPETADTTTTTAEPLRSSQEEREDIPAEAPKEDASEILDKDSPILAKKEKTDEEPAFEAVIAESTEVKATKQENYDPTLDLGSYRYPTLSLLDEFEKQSIKVTGDELENNKNKIVETLTNFKIAIDSIKATIGPTVTLYEIIPEAGVKISKIKNLEDDIALSLAALGIRIIAPIPGKGTIGIEVPNKDKELVSIRSVFATDKFMKSDKDLPIVMGKTISNEVLVSDLAKMPHLLMAGATGQGKSVGLNVILASLIYKKHPSQLKFVLVDPKKVELTLFNKLERHFLAKLPDSEDAIITDTKLVVNTLNSLCIEMDNRYDLLKNAMVRNIKEYNTKFIQRKLIPTDGHHYLPYIVVVIDELADLMMTAGKEVEGPIARIAQLARAVGIHLIIATQRPSVNVITGTIKANFPARLSFRVTSKIDSRTILDAGGADQLIGLGDMLLSMGTDVIRLQCPFIDTHEVDNVCEFIGNQRGYGDAYMLPEYAGEEASTVDVDISDRDVMFEEAARVIVRHQQGSTSLIQRKLKLGYNRAGRIIDQLEAAGIVGPFGGSKARDVLIPDEYSLEQLLNELNGKSSSDE